MSASEDYMDINHFNDIAAILGIDPDDLTIEVRSKERTTVVFYENGDRVKVGEVANIGELGPFVAGLRAGARLSR